MALQDRYIRHALAVALLAAATASASAATPAPSRTVNTNPPPQLVLADSGIETVHDSDVSLCGSTKVHIDGPVRFFEDQDQRVHMAIGDPSARAWQWTGSVAQFAASPGTATRDCTPVMLGNVGNNVVDRFDQKTFLQGFYFDAATGYVYGYGHEDYFGTRLDDPDCHAGGTTDGKSQCWYSAVAMWKADTLAPNGHLSFAKINSVPWQIAIYPHVTYPGDTATPKAGWIGYGAPSNIVRGRNPDGTPDGYSYMFAYASAAYGGQAHDVCLFRSDDPAVRGSWRAWNGNTSTPAFTQGMNNPYISSTAPCTVVNPGAANFNSYVRSVHGHAASGHYIALFRDGNGVRYASSPDLVNWSASQALWTSSSAQVNYPALVDLDSGTAGMGDGDDNFDTVYDQGKTYVYFRTSVASGHTQINRQRIEVANYP